jgi:Sulfotransferase family
VDEHGHSPGTEELQAELERVQLKLEKTRQLADARKLRYERAEAELLRIRAGWPQRAYRLARRAVGRREPAAFCLFIGYPRSGHSLLGSLLDAHPDAVIAHEVNVLKLVGGGVGRRQLVHTLVERASADADRAGGRRATGYSYAVPGQWQGHVRRLQVLGSKAGEKATAGIGREPGQLARLRRLVHAPVRLLHVTRNPFDMIARMSLITKDGKPERTLAGATDFTARLARTNARIIAERGTDVLTVRHERVVSEPLAELRRICTFLGLEQDDAWLSACAGVVFPQPKLARELVQWTPEERATVEELIAGYQFFEGYSWTSKT